MIKQLINRVSCGRLTSPAPSQSQLDLCFQAALRAPDHKGLKPWKYLVYRGENALNELGDAYLKASLMEDSELEQAKQDRARSLPHRAPMVIVAVAKNHGDEKVPHIEEVVSTGAGVQNLMLALNDLGYGTYWRTGPLTYNPYLKPLIGINPEETIVGFVYVGTADMEVKSKPVPNVDDFVVYHE